MSKHEQCRGLSARSGTPHPRRSLLQLVGSAYRVKVGELALRSNKADEHQHEHLRGPRASSQGWWACWLCGEAEHTSP
jgi:hypothetical protein